MNNENEEWVNEPEVIFENTDILVINKPAGLVVHPSSQMLRMKDVNGVERERTLADWLIEKYPEIKDVGESWKTQSGEVILRPGIVHRLDRETSGVMVIVKNQKSYEHLKNQFKERKVSKEYRAIVNGAFKNDVKNGIIDKPIGKSPSDFRKWSAQPGARGVLREAVTEYTVLSNFGVGNDGFAYVAAMPKTGRTHQIRVHFKSIHHPVLGDKLYGIINLNKKKSTSFVFRDFSEIKRTMLHAYKIKFNDLNNMKMEFKVEIPKDFEKVLKYAKLSLND